MNISITYVLSNSWFMFDEKPLEIFRSASAPHDVMEFLLWPSTTLHHQPIWLCAILPTMYLDTMRCWPLWPLIVRQGGLSSEPCYAKIYVHNSQLCCMDFSSSMSIDSNISNISTYIIFNSSGTQTWTPHVFRYR